MEHYKKKLLKRTCWVWALVAFSVIFTISAYAGVLIPKCESPAIWFQRSGSVVTVLVLIADYLSFRVTSSHPEVEELEAIKSFSWLLPVTKGVAIIMTIAGTLTWGYGDIIYNMMQ